MTLELLLLMTQFVIDGKRSGCVIGAKQLAMCSMQSHISFKDFVE